MCNPTTARTNISMRRPAVDVAHLLSRVNVKTAEYVKPKASVEQTRSEIEASAPTTLIKKRNQHYTVQHDYHDHAYDNRADYQEEHPARGGVTIPFPIKLHEMLEAMAAEGNEDIVSWQPHGRSFLIHKPKEFVNILPRFFKLSKIASFQRQLNLYGFQRLTRGRDRGGYYHELFLRSRVFMAHSIQRIKVKGTGVRARSNPDQEPDFWSMPWVSVNTGKINEQADQQSDRVSSMPMNVGPIPSSSLSQNFPILPQPEDDVLLGFGSWTFHSVDHRNTPEATIRQPQSAPDPWDNFIYLLSEDADSILEDLDFPENMLGEEDIEDDLVFGRLLEQMIS